MAFRNYVQAYQCPRCTEQRKTKSGIFGHMASRHPDWEYNKDLVMPVKYDEVPFQTEKEQEANLMVTAKIREDKKVVSLCPVEECKEPLYGNEYRCPKCKIELHWDDEEE